MYVSDGVYMRDYSYGSYLLKLRENAGLSQKELAVKLGITNKAVSKWENGNSKPSLEQIIKLSEIFGESIENIVKMQVATQDKQITKIVVTGGPCAGKSTALNSIRETFVKNGYTVLFVSETATDLINGGISPWTCGDIDFQCTVLRLQYQREKVFEDAAKMIVDNNKILIVCDRGLMDSKAYVSEYEFYQILKKLNMSEIEMRDSYDGVFHLVTAAIGAPDFYSSENNKARYETADEAAKVDKRTLNAWIGHPHLRVIDNSTDFDSKIKRLLSEISVLLGEPEPYEIERKYLVKMPNFSKIEKDFCAKRSEIIQTYLKSDKGDEIRIRQRGKEGNYIYSQTIKKIINNLKRIEVEQKLTKEEYLNLIMQADTNKRQIRKTRYCFMYNNQYFELDVYPFWKDVAILEVELSSEEQEVEIPKQISVIKEVTDDINYKNSTLANLK